MNNLLIGLYIIILAPVALMLGAILGLAPIWFFL